MIVCYFSAHGPQEWFQARAFCLALRLFQLAIYNSEESGKVMSPLVYHDTYNKNFHDAIQLFVLFMFLACFVKKLKKYVEGRQSGHALEKEGAGDEEDGAGFR